jgi:hypothetical protein
MAAAAEILSLKLFIDRKSQRLLFAEVDNEFVDFLFSIFTLPVGAVTRLLKEADGGGMVGCLPSLYRSIENLSVNYIQIIDKYFLLEPKVIMPGAKIPHLLPNVCSTFRQLSTCPRDCSRSRVYVADEFRAICPKCDCRMDREVTFLDTQAQREIGASSACEEGYVKETVKYMVMDDLGVKPLSTASLVTLLTQFNVNVNDIGAIEERVVDFGMDEAVKLLRASLQSNTVLTDIFLPAEIEMDEK